MARSPTETGEEARDVELARSEPTVRKDAAIERWPIEPTDRVRCAACTVRSAKVPVLPGCEILVLDRVMRVSMPPGARGCSAKKETGAQVFSCRLSGEVFQVGTKFIGYLKKTTQSIDGLRFHLERKLKEIRVLHELP